jgi:hypothetical protein
MPVCFPEQPILACIERPPMPFVVGVGRSGTTLLRLMLDAHPELVISPETPWLEKLIQQVEADATDIVGIKKILLAAPNWGDMKISEAQLDPLLARARGPDFIRGLYHLYAEVTPEKSQARVGDKTPTHALAMINIARILPEAHFIHIIRDGRDVAISHRDLWFGPGTDPEAAAHFWVGRIQDTRRQAQSLPHYLEVRYEELILEPELTLRRIGEFIQLPFDPRQLTYPVNAAQRLAELGDVQWPNRLITAEMRRGLFTLTRHPPNATRIGRWRQEMTGDEVRAFENVAGDLLAELGYPISDNRRMFNAV